MKSVGVDALIDPNRNIAMRSQDNVGSCLFKFPHTPSFLGQLYIMVQLPLAVIIILIRCAEHHWFAMTCVIRYQKEDFGSHYPS